MRPCGTPACNFSALCLYKFHGVQDEFPGILRFACSVFPSDDDDVVTSPYNALLALNQLLEHADCVLPLENQALQEIATRMEVHIQHTSTLT